MFRRIITGVAVSGLFLASPLSATKTYCYTSGGFSACASATITVNAGQSELKVAIQNLSHSVGNTVYTLTALGLYYLEPPAYTGQINLSSGPNGWQNGPGSVLISGGPTLLAGQHALWLGGARATNPATLGLLGCAPFPRNTTGLSTCAGPLTFTFNLTPGRNFNLNALDLAFRGQSWQTFVAGTRAPAENFLCYSTNVNCVVTSNVPEPVTTGLLAVGLVGMGGVSLARRRSKRGA